MNNQKTFLICCKYKHFFLNGKIMSQNYAKLCYFLTFKHSIYELTLAIHPLLKLSMQARKTTFFMAYEYDLRRLWSIRELQL